MVFVHEKTGAIGAYGHQSNILTSQRVVRPQSKAKLTTFLRKGIISFDAQLNCVFKSSVQQEDYYDTSR